MQIDFGKTAQDYGRYRAGFPPALFERSLHSVSAVPANECSTSAPAQEHWPEGLRYEDAK